MAAGRSFRWVDFGCLVLLVALAAGVRLWYVSACLEQPSAPAPYLAQARVFDASTDSETRLAEDNLITNLKERDWFGSRAPLSPQVEDTAHVAPGYPWAVAMVYRLAGDRDPLPLIRWAQCVLGALTAGLYFLFARLAFSNRAVALLTGLFCAVNPFWIINVAQVEDGVLASFLLAGVLVLGTRAAQTTAPFSSLIFGLALAALALVREALLPFTVVGLLWFLLRCRDLSRGWFVALLAVLGFVNGVVPWGVRNFQTFHEVIPIADSTWLHLWMGNNPAAQGREMENWEIRSGLSAERWEQLLSEPSQPRRYQMLAEDVVQFVRDNPAQTIRNRINAGLYFFLGWDWFHDSQTEPGENPESRSNAPSWLQRSYPVIISGTLLFMLVLAALGWRWTYGWRRRTGLATLAMLWIPLPYVLTHAESLWGPRLPLDGLLLCYVAFALVYLLPGLGRGLADGPHKSSSPIV